MRKSYFFMIGVVGIVLIFAICYLVPLFVHWDPEKNSLLDRLFPPEGFARGLEGHVFGTDALGRDVLSRILIGGQYSFRLAFMVVVLQMVIGTVLGILSGYLGGWADIIIMRACDAIMSMPTLIMAIAVLAVLGPSTQNLVLVLTLSGWIQLCKVVRNNVRVVKRQEFVLASRDLGAKLSHIMFSQILPNVTTNIIIIASQRLGFLIIMEASLSFLGLGIQPPAPSWGNMISAGRQYMTTQPWLILVPGFALMLAVLSFNFLGDGIRDVLDPKRKM
ncbi:MAG: ABC transporter permease [Peptococcaceae bacterium]|jgi:peptide/nickel transport system permease protein|nr:ABC transporter permease [Peptococcaceae bacterium]